MHIGEICTRNVVFCSPDTSIVEAARLMREHHVGDLLVAVEEPDGVHPVGIVTDRDIVIEVIALEVPLDRVTVKDIMSRSLFVVEESEGIYETLSLMRQKGVRRAPVMTSQGDLAGIITLDDILENVSEEFGLIAKLLAQERQREIKGRSITSATSNPA